MKTQKAKIPAAKNQAKSKPVAEKKREAKGSYAPKKTAKTMTTPTENRTDWFVDARFGMFIHWGLYAVPARHEWVRNHERITNEEYQKYFDIFNPDLFQPKEWAKAAREAGMKYFVITTKHHEGFCLWDSKFTDYKVTNTPVGRDLLREVVDAFRTEGIHVGFYYSLLDWHHPDFTIDRNHPLRDSPDKDKLNEGRNMKRYAKYMRDQVTELLANYGKIDILWFDFSYTGENGKGRDDWESEKLVALIRKLQPHVIIDNRLDLPGSGDIQTPEQFQPERPVCDENGNPVVWEGCQTFSGSWGYHRDEQTWKSAKQCIGMLIRHVARGGNLIMNVGPTSRGYIDDRAMERLADFGKWMKYNGRSIYGCGIAPKGIIEPNGCVITYNESKKRLYIHIFDWPFGRINVMGLAGKVKYAQILHDGSEIGFTDNAQASWNSEKQAEGTVTFWLPVANPKPDMVVPVIEVFLK